MNNLPPYQKPLTDAEVCIIGKDSNARIVMDYIRRCILQSNHPELSDEFMREAAIIGALDNYNHLLLTCVRYVIIK